MHTPHANAAAGALRQTPAAFVFTRAAYSRTEAQRILSLGRTSMWKLEKEGRLTPLRFGKKVLYSAQDLSELLAKLRSAA